ncbi:hypothetical protein ACHAWX_005142, partial [Stephanocyclus meneghinianus]
YHFRGITPPATADAVLYQHLRSFLANAPIRTLLIQRLLLFPALVVMPLRHIRAPTSLYKKSPLMQFNLACISSSICFQFLIGSKPFSTRQKQRQSHYRRFLRSTFLDRQQQEQLHCDQKCSFITDTSLDKAIYSNTHYKRITPNSSDLMNAKMNEEDLSALRKKKQLLRKEVRTSIKANFPEDEAAKLLMQSNLVFSRLFDLPQYQSAKSIGFFLSMPYGEIQTRDAIRKIVQDEKVLFVPRVGLDFEKCDMDMVKAVIPPSSDNREDQQFYDFWPKNKWNIPEPPIENDSSGNTLSLIAQPGDIDLLLVPGLAFDSNGHRLGQGKGYYDRFISRMRCTADENKREEKKPLLVGVCLDEQFLDADGFDGIPVTDHDYIMDMVLTPTRTLVVAITSR